MGLMTRLIRWWKIQTGKTDTPFDGESPYWVFSLVAHLVLIVLLAKWAITTSEPEELEVVSIAEEEIEIVDEPLPPPPIEFTISDEVFDEIGADSDAFTDMALSKAPVVADLSELPTPDIPETLNTEFHLDLVAETTTGVEYSSVTVKGSAGEATTGAKGAIDRITKEILISRNERPTTVVWLFDQSASLLRQRAEIVDRIDRIYKELEYIDSTKSTTNPASDSTSDGDETVAKDLPEQMLVSTKTTTTKKARYVDPRVLTCVYAFGNSVERLTRKPTDDIDAVKSAISSIERDDSGIERVFTAIYSAAKQFQGDRRIDKRTRQPKRNVMLIVVSDEAGDDVDGLDPTVAFCRKLEIPVYVIGVPAPFGREATPVKWVDPDPDYDQTPQWTTVKQGPESLAPERVRLHFAGDSEDTASIDSGFGPFALTRICYETGGIYFTVHPNRRVNRRIGQRETAAYSAYFSRFFEQEKMRRYRPDYVSSKTYWDSVGENKARMSLVQAAQRSFVSQMESPVRRFEKLDEATFVRTVTQAQQQAASLEPQINGLYSILSMGESDRDRETIPRWQAGYDLAMGRVMSVKVRTEAYNSMLARSKSALKFKDARNNTWVLQPDDDVSTGGQAKRNADKARMYLNRVVEEHPGTPWALLAQRELDTPLGWRWDEQYTEPPKPAPRMRRPPTVVNNVPRTPRDERARMLARPKERRPPPKL